MYFTVYEQYIKKVVALKSILANNRLSSRPLDLEHDLPFPGCMLS